ncbi:hypothetical protein J5N97_013783 [Dioscorea zingiberensis]|uniref:Inhibitor I9 domain-containing protein n=1 Tax=Dioscorea zingiberensis TaxID=325984 RepID=A0A9D5CSM2_9LILI|nr:hypothetical protein J5N97_013783 [Dioscorea zingiberensis]
MMAMAMTLLSIATLFMSAHQVACSSSEMKSSSTGTHRSCRTYTLDSGEHRLVQSYSVVISGFTTKLTKAELRDMEALDGFVFAQLDEHRNLGTTYAPEFLGLTQFNGL